MRASIHNHSLQARIISTLKPSLKPSPRRRIFNFFGENEQKTRNQLLCQNLHNQPHSTAILQQKVRNHTLHSHPHCPPQLSKSIRSEQSRYNLNEFNNSATRGASFTSGDSLRHALGSGLHSHELDATPCAPCADRGRFQAP